MITKESIGVFIVTGIEAVAFFGGVGIWFYFERRGHPVLGAVLGTGFWTVVTELEHYVAQALGFNQPLLRGFPFGLRRK